jgi:hypothetical protein
MISDKETAHNFRLLFKALCKGLRNSPRKTREEMRAELREQVIQKDLKRITELKLGKYVVS